MQLFVSRDHRSDLHAQGVLAAALSLSILGCGGAPKPAPVSPEPRHVASDDGPKPFSNVRLSANAEALELDCDYGSYEQCNALDDDCNGVIDDECGYEGGDVQITVAWNSGADIDLYVTDPSGATLYYNKDHKRSKIGGHLDHDARGDCRREQQNNRIENAYWPAPARSGQYKVELHYFSPCAKGAATEATLSVTVGRELLGAYRFKLDPEQRIEALQFTKK